MTIEEITTAPSPTKGKAWVTLITNTKYLSGLLTLEYSLRAVGSKYPLVALYTSTFPAEGHAALDARGIQKKEVEYLLPKVDNDYSNDTRFYDCWSKLQPFRLTEYSRVVLLDSDMLVRQNMDELMTMPLDIHGNSVFAAVHACVCNPLKKAHYPTTFIPSVCGFTSQHSTPDLAQTRGADPTYGLGMMNGGLVVVQPDQDLFDKIMQTIQDPTKTMNYAFADQSLLSDTFRGRWTSLSYKYNALKTLRWCHKEIWRDEEIKNIHYILSPKPWDSRDSQEETHAWWWEVTDRRYEEEKINGTRDAF
ncbi:nucleotide-diphospho-sugar transferase [Pyronema omphalodes]|nr:nucleotide-diphospho-sugar transferase [Pyronema omphalodes]